MHTYIIHTHTYTCTYKHTYKRTYMLLYAKMVGRAGLSRRRTGGASKQTHIWHIYKHKHLFNVVYKRFHETVKTWPPNKPYITRFKRRDSGTSGGRRILNTRGPQDVAESQILGDHRIVGVIRRWNVCPMATLTLILTLRPSRRLRRVWKTWKP